MNIMALILAGGQSRRMNGQDKGLIQWHGKAFIDCVIGCVQPQVSNIVISANRHLEEYAQRNFSVVTDSPKWQGLGPVAALATLADKHIFDEVDWLLVVPCDSLFLPPNLVSTFLAASVRFPLSHAFYVQVNQQPHYSVMFIRPQLLLSSIMYLDSGKRSIHGWLQLNHAVAVEFPLASEFVNYNSLHDMEGE